MYCAACNVESGPTLFCHVCDNYLPNPQTGPKAGLVRRATAVIVDQVLSITIFLLSIRWFIFEDSASSSGGRIIVLVSSAAIIVYSIAFFASLASGMTPGKGLFGIYAINKRNGGLPGLGRMLLRETIGKLVSGCFLSLGFFWAIWDRDSQAWHDKLAGTVVIRRSAEFSSKQPPDFWPMAACIAFAGVLALQIFTVAEPSWSETTEAQSVTQRAPIYDATPSYKSEPAPRTLNQGSVEEAPSSPSIDQSTAYHEPAVGTAAQTNDFDRNEIEETLSAWAAATRNNDAAKESLFYAPFVDRYYLERNVTREAVRQNEEADFAKGGFTDYQIGNLQFVTQSGDAAQVNLLKVYTLAASGITKQVHARLWLMHTSQGWKISGEQDLLH